MDLSQTFNTVGELLVKVLYAVVILFVGWVIAKVLAAIVARLLHWLRLDERLGKAAGENKVPRLERILTLAVYYLILLFAIVAALEALGLTLVTQPLNALLNAIFAYIPSLIAGGVVIFIAWLVATILRAIAGLETIDTGEIRSLGELDVRRVEARSEGVGRGAEFTIRLPLQAVPSVASAARSVGGHQARRVFIIEDNVDAADSLREALELAGHEVEVAYNGVEGIERARRFKPEIVLCDIGLPGMNGYEVAQALRNDQTFASVYLVALTGYALPEDLAKAHRAGFDLHVAKPPSPEKLQEALVRRIASKGITISSPSGSSSGAASWASSFPSKSATSTARCASTACTLVQTTTSR